MESLLIKLVNMSVSAGWLVLAVVVIRLVFRKVPKALHCLLWAMAAIRLVCPFTMESRLSLIPSAETIPQESAYIGDVVKIDSGFEQVDREVNAFIETHEWIADVEMEEQGPQRSTALWWLSAIWLFGITAMLTYGWISYRRLKKQVEISLPGRDYYLCDHLETPFILGVIRPRIYLPSGLTGEQMAGVMAHEQAHLQRRDHWWKLLGFVLLSVYWFHPLIWLGYLLFCRDMEMACDERVIRMMSVQERKQYSEILLSLSIARDPVAVCPLAFGEVGVKERIKAVLTYRKTGVWVLMAAVSVCVVLALCFLTDPVSDGTTRIIIGDGYTDCETVDVEVKYLLWESSWPYFIDREEDDPYLVMTWGNRTGQTISYGEYFDIYRKDRKGDPVKCELRPTEYEVTYHDILYFVEGETAERKFSLGAYDLSEEGEYLICFEFYLGEDSSVTYTGYLEFSVEKISTKGYTELDKVDAWITEVVLGGKWPYVAMEWNNLSGKTIEYGLLYRLYYRSSNGSLIECSDRNGGVAYDLISLYGEGRNPVRFFELWYWDMSKSGDYVIAFEFNLSDEEWPVRHQGYLEFKVP